MREFSGLLAQLDRQLDTHRHGGVRVKNGDLVVPAFEAEQRPPSVVALEETVSARLPRIELTGILQLVRSHGPV